jgi:hypothetical protein
MPALPTEVLSFLFPLMLVSSGWPHLLYIMEVLVSKLKAAYPE